LSESINISIEGWPIKEEVKRFLTNEAVQQGQANVSALVANAGETSNSIAPL